MPHKSKIGLPLEEKSRRLAEVVGFEPTVAMNHTRFRDWRIRPGYATPPVRHATGAARLGEYSKLARRVTVIQDGRSAIRSGAETPTSSRPDASTWRVAATSLSREFVKA